LLNAPLPPKAVPVNVAECVEILDTRNIAHWYWHRGLSRLSLVKHAGGQTGHDGAGWNAGLAAQYRRDALTARLYGVMLAVGPHVPHGPITA
jgi:hypothetical protein